MSREQVIDLSALIGKVAVEQTELHPIAKFSINLGIDVVAECLKREVTTDIEKICCEAKRFDVERVIAIPLCSLAGKELVAIRVYGNNSAAFIKALGMQLISEDTQSNILSDIKEMEKNFGILIYEKTKSSHEGIKQKTEN